MRQLGGGSDVVWRCLLIIGCVAPLALQAQDRATFAYAGVLTTAPPVITGVNGHGKTTGYLEGSPSGFRSFGRSSVDVQPPGAVQTFPTSINNAENIVGGYVDASGVLRGFSLVAGVYADVTPPLPVLATSADQINNAGQIAGVYEDAAGYHGYLLTHGTFDLFDIPATTLPVIVGLNEAGALTGYALGNAGMFSFVRIGRRLSIFQAPGATFTQAAGIDAANDVFGTASDGPTQQGFRRTSSGVFHAISVPGAPNTSVIYGVNASGEVLGSAVNGSGNSEVLVRIGSVWSRVTSGGPSKIGDNGAIFGQGGPGRNVCLGQSNCVYGAVPYP
jgi:hypothetical protein